MTSEPCTVLPMTRPMIGCALTRQFGFDSSGSFLLGQGGQSFGLHALMRSSGWPRGHGIVAQHDGSSTLGGVGHLPLHAGQPGGAPVEGQIILHAGILGSNVNSSQPCSIAGTSASFGGSLIASLSGSKASAPACSSNVAVSLYLPASPRPTA